MGGVFLWKRGMNGLDRLKDWQAGALCRAIYKFGKSERGMGRDGMGRGGTGVSDCERRLISVCVEMLETIQIE